MTEKYLAVMTTVLVATQVIRVIQNTINLVRQNKVVKKELERLGDVSEADMERQKEVNKLAIRYFKQKLTDEDTE